MVLGETIQAIGLINADPSLNRVLIVCPASLKLNWAKEIRKWRTRPLTVEIVNGSNRMPQGGVAVINYDILSRHEAALNEREWDCVILDEAIIRRTTKRNAPGSRTRFPQKKRLYLTGTPISNRPVELFPLISALGPERWNKKTFFSFAKRYCGAKQVPAGRKMVWDSSGATRLDELQKELRSTMMIRRRKADVLKELPPKRRAIVELEGDDTIKAIAAREMAAWEARKAEIEALRESANLVLEINDKEAYASAVVALRNAASAAFTEMSAVRHECAVAKAPLAVKFITEQLEGSDGKIVVFAHHRDVAEIAKNQLAPYNPVMVIGGMSAEAKNSSVERFQNDPASRVFIGNIQAAGVDLTPAASSHVIFLELDWVPASVSQAEDRCVMGGQLVLTKSLGLVPIENIKCGDEVLTHAGNWRKVTETHGRQIRSHETITEIRYEPFPDAPLRTTSDHRILIKRGDAEPTWIEAQHVKPRDLLCMPRVQASDLMPKAIDGFPINYRMLELFGWSS
jgi:SWI/SNF-related matrix-associated actin-dependent regulator 1 of chromatin subfamily A